MPDPIPVEVASVTAPIPVVLAGPVPPAHAQIQAQAIDPSVPATTTFQEDLTTAGQRQINLIWERTQAAIAIVVVLFTMFCGAYGMVYQQTQIPTIMSVAFGTVVGFYFSRTNHSAIGGTGPKPRLPPYEGR